MQKALLFESHGKPDELKVRCLLCAHHCILGEGQAGVCGVRKNRGGTLYSLNYDKVAATHNDPIEKKPLYHFLPGSTSYSLAAMGCNFSCKFCQNSSLSEVRSERHIDGDAISPVQLVASALDYGAQSISYTYSEPTVYFELMLETAQLAHQQGLKNNMVTNGFMSVEALEMIGPYLDAANVDLKAYSDLFYKTWCGGRMEPVKETIRGMKARGVWVEVTTLMIPGLNDNREELKQLIGFMLEVDENMPWHVSRFYPQHRLMDRGPTSPAAIFSILETAREMGLKYVYAGNVASDKFSDTRCPGCGALLIQRNGYYTRIIDLKGSQCGSCQYPVAGVFTS